MPTNVILNYMPIEDNNPTNRQITDAAWDELSKDYWWYKKGERAKMPNSFEAFYQEHRTKFKDVLDVGCGTGRFLIPMVQDGLNVIGLEPSSGMRKGLEINLKAAKAILKGTVKIAIGESKKLDFPDASFDFVFAKGSIHHNTWEEIQQSFREAARVLKKGQFFLFQGRSPKDSALSHSEPVLGDIGHTAKDLEGKKKGVIEHYFTEEEIRQLGAENGLEIVVGPEERVKDDGNARFWVVYRKI